MRSSTLTPTRFVTARYGPLAPADHLRWSLASHGLGACARRHDDPEVVLSDGGVWQASAQAIWPEARGIDDPALIKPVLDTKVGREALLSIRSQVLEDLRWALGHLGPGVPRQIGATVTRHVGELRVFGQVPFVLDDAGVWTLVSFDDGARSRDLVRCWAWLADAIPTSPGVQFIRLLDPVGHHVNEWVWDRVQHDQIEHELTQAGVSQAA